MKARAANFVARLGTTGDIVVWPIQPSGTVHMILDATGYFEDPPSTPIATLEAFANIATFGSSPQTIAHLRDVGINGWITEQIAMPPNYYIQPALAAGHDSGHLHGNVPAGQLHDVPAAEHVLLQRALRVRTSSGSASPGRSTSSSSISGQQEIQPSQHGAGT